MRPVSPHPAIPTAPDRYFEMFWSVLACLGIGLMLLGILYVWIGLEMPGADALTLLPIAALPGLLFLQTFQARRKRLAAAREFERYRRGIAQAFSEISKTPD